MMVSKIYSWAGTKRSAEEVVTILRSQGYKVEKITVIDTRLAEYDPLLWKRKHTPFNPANVPGL